MFAHAKGRSYVENALNNAVEKNKPTPRLITSSRCDRQFETLLEADELVTVWSQMTTLRNDIAHIGMNLSPQPTVNLKERAASIYPRLRSLGQRLLPQRE